MSRISSSPRELEAKCGAVHHTDYWKEFGLGKPPAEEESPKVDMSHMSEEMRRAWAEMLFKDARRKSIFDQLLDSGAGITGDRPLLGNEEGFSGRSIDAMIYDEVDDEYEDDDAYYKSYGSPEWTKRRLKLLCGIKFLGI